MGNSKAVLAAMLAGTPTKETARITALTNGKSTLSEAEDLPSAKDIKFSKVVGKNGQMTYVKEGDEASVKGGYATIPDDAILGLLSGKGASLVREEIMNKKEEELKSKQPQTVSLLNENILQTGEPVKLPENLNELIENKVYEVLGQIVGEMGTTLKDKEKIKTRLAEAASFLKLTESLKK